MWTFRTMRQSHRLRRPYLRAPTLLLLHGASPAVHKYNGLAPMSPYLVSFLILKFCMFSEAEAGSVPLVELQAVGQDT